MTVGAGEKLTIRLPAAQLAEIRTVAERWGVSLHHATRRLIDRGMPTEAELLQSDEWRRKIEAPTPPPAR